jgi:hypothetical protein
MCSLQTYVPGEHKGVTDKNIFIWEGALLIMMYFIIGVIVLFILIIVSMKMEHTHARMKLIGILIFLTFLYFSITFIITKTEAQLNDFKSLVGGTQVYFNWLVNAASGVFDFGKDAVMAVGNVIKTSMNG